MLLAFSAPRVSEGRNKFGGEIKVWNRAGCGGLGHFSFLHGSMSESCLRSMTHVKISAHSTSFSLLDYVLVSLPFLPHVVAQRHPCPNICVCFNIMRLLPRATRKEGTRIPRRNHSPGLQGRLFRERSQRSSRRLRKSAR